MTEWNTPYIIYEGNNSAAPHHHWNVGKEAMTYLKYIADYYECLPEVRLLYKLLSSTSGFLIAFCICDQDLQILVSLLWPKSNCALCTEVRQAVQ